MDWSHRDLPASALIGEVIHCGGSGFSWTGLAVHASSAWVVLMDGEGRLARVARDETVSGPLGGRKASRLAERAAALLERQAVRDAVRLMRDTPIDPAGYDLWRLPLGDLTHPARPLSGMVGQYCRWDAYTRRRFEQVLGLLVEEAEAEAQVAAYYDTVLGAATDDELAQRRGCSVTAVRMARMRARRFVRRYMGEVLTDETHDLQPAR